MGNGDHIASGLMSYFIAAYILPLEVTLEYVYPSWFITLLNRRHPEYLDRVYWELGRSLPWFSFVFDFRQSSLNEFFIRKIFEDSAIPLITLDSTRLTLFSWLSICLQSSLFPFVIGSLILSQLTYLCIVFNMKRMLKGRLYPSYAASTFPFSYLSDSDLQGLQSFVEPLFY